jgi:eukaryotic-like serine/threonine-protein kinase
VLDARTGIRKDLVRGSASARYVRTGHLAYARNGDLFVQPFDLERLELTGPAVRLAQGVDEDTDGIPSYDFSATGALVYCPGWSGGPRNVLTLVDLKGNAEATSFPPGPIVDQRFSPDGRRISLTLTAAKNNTWVYDVARRTHTRITDGRYHFPVWTPDGRLTMARGSLSATAIVTRRGDGEGPDEELLPIRGQQFPSDWTRDGRTLFYEQSSRETSWDIWTVGGAARTATPVVATRFPERHPRVSPDGRWLAYVSRETRTLGCLCAVAGGPSAASAGVGRWRAHLGDRMVARRAPPLLPRARSRRVDGRGDDSPGPCGGPPGATVCGRRV